MQASDLEQRQDLGGEWEFETEDGRRGTMAVPSNWHLAGLPNYTGAVTFRRRFQAEPAAQDECVRLVFHGVDYVAEVALNGAVLGRHEGYFQPFAFDVTDLLLAENELVVRVDSPREPPEIWPHRKRLIKGIFNHHDCRPGSWDPEHGQDGNTGGIWNRVELVRTSATFVRWLRVAPQLLPDGRARLRVRAGIAAAARSNLRAVLRIEPPSGASDGLREHAHEFAVEPGADEIGFAVTLERPQLWWCWDQGEQPLYRAELTLFQAGSSSTGNGPAVREERALHRRAERFGVRELRIDTDWVWRLNGRRIFPRGANIIPAQWLAEYDAARIDADVHLLREANVNAVRVHAHVNRDELYEALDRAGILVWQDFALQWSYDDGDEFAADACRQAREMVETLFNHPSVVVWCCHNEPVFNRQTLDPVLAATVQEADSSRHVDVASDFRFHTYPGWYSGSYLDYRGLPAAPFVSEFGAQALPDAESLRTMLLAEDLWPPNWAAWSFHDFQYLQTFALAGIEMGESLEEFVRNSQAYQAELLRYAVEQYRRHRFDGVTGLFQFMFMDCWPSVTWSVVDYWRRPKAGYRALRRAYQPLFPSLGLQPDPVVPGRRVRPGLLVLNEYPHAVTGLRVSLLLAGADGIVAQAEGPLDHAPADAATRYAGPGSDGLLLPEGSPPGRYELQVRLWDADGLLVAENAAPFPVVALPPGAGRVSAQL